MVLFDFYFFYGAGNVLRGGGNPYDELALDSAMRKAGFPHANVVPLAYPPWCVYLFYGFAILPFAVAATVWTVFSAAVVVSCTRQSVKDKPQRISGFQAALATALFFPVIRLLVFGQTTSLVLLGLCLALHFHASRAEFRTGLALSLALFKPHLLLPFFAAVAVHGALRRRTQRIAGMAAGLGAQLGLSLLVRPSIITDYVGVIGHFIERTRTWPYPTVGQLLQRLTGWRTLGHVVVGGAVVAGGLSGAQDPLSTGWYCLLTSLSLAFAPFALGHDHLLLLPAYLRVVRCHIRQRERTTLLVLSLQLISGALAVVYPRYEPALVLIPLGILLLCRFTRDAGEPSGDS